MPLPGKQSKAKTDQTDQLFHANLCPGVRCSLCPLIFFNEHSLFIWFLREPARTEVRAKEHKTDTKAAFAPEGFSPRLNFLALYKYSVVTSRPWQYPIPLTPLCLRPGLPQTPWSRPAGPRTPLMYPASAGGFAAALSCQSPTKDFGAFIYIFTTAKLKPLSLSLLIIPDRLSIFHMPEDERWEQSQTWIHVDAAL